MFGDRISSYVRAISHVNYRSYYVTEQVRYSYALGQYRVVFEVSSVLLVLNERHDRLPNSVSPIAEMTIFAVDGVLWCNFPPSE